MSKENKREPAFCQKWIESERGWGRRPDGVSIHLTKDDAKAFIAAYWERMPERTPDEYSMPEGKAFLVLIEHQIYEQLLAAVEKEGLGLRFNQSIIPDMKY